MWEETLRSNDAGQLSLVSLPNDVSWFELRGVIGVSCMGSGPTIYHVQYGVIVLRRAWG